MAEEKNIPQASGKENQKVVMNFGGADIEATIDKDGRIVLPNEIQQMLAAEAQEKLASIAWDYYQRIAYETDNNGKPTDKTRLLKFKLNRPVVEDGVVGQVMEQTVEAPFIGLVPIPSLLIDRIDIDFQMEVTDTNTEKTNSSAEASTNISSKWFGVKVDVAGKVSSSRENTRSTN